MAKEEAQRKANDEEAFWKRLRDERQAKEEAAEKAFWKSLGNAKEEEAERKAKEEAKRKAKEEAEEEAFWKSLSNAKEEEAKHKAKEEAERPGIEVFKAIHKKSKDAQEAKRKAEEAKHKAKEEDELTAKEEAKPAAKEEAKPAAKEEETAQIFKGSWVEFLELGAGSVAKEEAKHKADVPLSWVSGANVAPEPIVDANSVLEGGT